MGERQAGRERRREAGKGGRKKRKEGRWKVNEEKDEKEG